MTTYNLTLDRNRPYGEVHGEDTGGAYFDQDGFLFDFEGKLIEALLTSAQRDQIDKMKAQAEAQASARAAYEQSLRAAGLNPADAPPMEDPEAEPPAPSQEGTIDLAGWAMGTKRYHFFTVKSALLEQYNFSATNSDAARKFLRDELRLAVD